MRLGLLRSRFAFPGSDVRKTLSEPSVHIFRFDAHEVINYGFKRRQPLNPPVRVCLVNTPVGELRRLGWPGKTVPQVRQLPRQTDLTRRRD